MLTTTEIRTAVTGAATEMLQPTLDKVEEHSRILGELQDLRAEGKSPNDDKVTSLEERLVELERDVAEQAKRIAKPKPNEADVFRGAFIKDVEAARLAFDPRQSRAIDSSLFASGGKLNPEQDAQFLDFVISQQVSLSRVVTRRMNSPQGNTDELTVAKRSLRAATEGNAPSVSDAVGSKRRVLTTVEVIWAEDLTLTFLEDNIERANAEMHIARLLATSFGNDLNDLAWNGDTSAPAGPDQAFLQINEGWMKIASGDADVHDVDAAGATTATSVLQASYQGMPDKFLGRRDQTFFTSVIFAQQYAEEVSKRETSLGDAVLVDGFPALRYFGIPIIPETVLQGSKLMLTPLSNLFHGVQRGLSVDGEWQPRRRVVEYTITGRNDYEYATGEAIVLTDNVPTSF